MMLSARLLYLPVVMLMAAHFPALAGSLTVAPVRVTISDTHPVETLTIRNEGDEATRLQMRIYMWRQEGGEDILQETQDVVANPRLFEIDGGGQQIARLGLRVPDMEVERSYRILIDQIPYGAQPAPGKVRALLRISIPVFVPPPAITGNIEWKLSPDINGDAIITVHNRRNSHLQIRHIALLQEDGTVIGGQDMFIYLLAGAQRQISLGLSEKAQISGQKYRLHVIADDGEFTEMVTGGVRQNAMDGP